MSIIKKILDEEIEKIKISKTDLEKIKNVSKAVCDELNKKLKKEKFNAQVFVGGSSAKNTVIKKENDIYDIDVFVRFDKKYPDDKISEILEKIVGKNVKKIHGSRDYFQKIVEGIRVEIIPVLKIKKPDEAENVTDLSYFHVNHILKKIKAKPKLSDDIKLAKSFTHAQDCYGAESYIKGFSGYALELLVCHYGSFLKFITDISKTQEKEKIIIDDSRFYKKKNSVFMEVNESKLKSPVILIDPTFRERNALAGLSYETFDKFKNSCIKFLKNPSKDFFKRKNPEEEFNDYKNYKIVLVKTKKQKGDIAGTKSKKFFDFFIHILEKEFIVKKSLFSYDEDLNIAKFYFSIDKKQEEIITGPPVTSVENLTRFKKAHHDAYIKDGFSYLKLKHDLKFEDYFKKFLKTYSSVIKEMDVSEVKIDG